MGKTSNWVEGLCKTCDKLYRWKTPPLLRDAFCPDCRDKLQDKRFHKPRRDVRRVNDLPITMEEIRRVGF